MKFLRGFQGASFLGIEFPTVRMVVKGGLREHVHEFPHAPGGAPEKLGRKLYEVTFETLFSDILVDYPAELWTGRLAELRSAFESETTGALVLPTIGTIQAYCFDWEQAFEAKTQSGEHATFRFREDGSSKLLVDSLVLPVEGVRAATDTFFAVVAAGEYTSSLFDLIQGVANAIVAIQDQTELYGNLLEAKALQLAQLCDRVDGTVNYFRNPENHELLDALHALWVSALRLHEDAVRLALPVVDYVAPRTMSVGDVARALYGDASRAAEVMQMNAIDDPLNIAAGAKLKVYRAA